MKNHQYELVIFLFMLLVIVLGGVGYSNTEMSHRIQDLEKSNEKLEDEVSVSTQKYWDQCAITIIMMNNMCDKDQKYLQQDTVYMELVTKYD